MDVQIHFCLDLITSFIPAPLEDVRFRKSERFIIKAHFFIKGHPLKKKCNTEYDLLSLPQRAGLETLYAALLISKREQPFSSINVLLKGFSNSS
ncbi:MAG TPA: hypothetical protein DE042_03225 [Colwellia sp.]|nr:hypothetical protein [Colwellia sp.]